MTNYKDPYYFPRALRAVQIKRAKALTDAERSLILLEQREAEERSRGYWSTESAGWHELENHECREDKLNALKWGIPYEEVKAERHRRLIAQAERYGVDAEEETRKAVAPYLEALDVADQLIKVATYGAAMIDLATVEADAEKRHAQVLEMLPE